MGQMEPFLAQFMSASTLEITKSAGLETLGETGLVLEAEEVTSIDEEAMAGESEWRRRGSIFTAVVGAAEASSRAARGSNEEAMDGRSMGAEQAKEAAAKEEEEHTYVLYGMVWYGMSAHICMCVCTYTRVSIYTYMYVCMCVYICHLTLPLVSLCVCGNHCILLSQFFPCFLQYILYHYISSLLEYFKKSIIKLGSPN